MFPTIQRGQLTTLQVNLGYRCNQACSHCHVNAGPTRTESMDRATLALVPKVLLARGIRCLDLTGGAPELHPHFRALVAEVRAMGVAVIDRCNLTILSEPGQEGLADFLAAQGVTVVASLPCYSAGNVDRQRGDGVFERSIAALQQLNGLGYGRSGSGLELHLVFNPQGPVLPPPQAELEATTGGCWQPISGWCLTPSMPSPTCRFSALRRCCGPKVNWRATRSCCGQAIVRRICRR